MEEMKQVKKMKVDAIKSKNGTFSIDEEGNLEVKSITITNEMAKIDLIYPVGSIYINTREIDPNLIWGGTWEKIAKGKTLVGVDENDFEFNHVKKEGGHKELQRHSHGGKTETGKTSFLRIVGAAGTGNASNHIPGYSASNYDDVENTGGYPGSNHYHEFRTEEEGEGNSGNMPPYITCYIWERIA